jgi:two-component system cell cycle response regulator
MHSHLSALVSESVTQERPLTVLILDIDHFKRVNDTHGHDIGDVVLKEFARRLKRSVRGMDLACRLGGEEFVVIMPETDLDRACQVAERIRSHAATETFDIGGTGEPLRVTASVGVASLERPGDTAEAIFKRADQALYVAKREGRNRVVADAA